VPYRALFGVKPSTIMVQQSDKGKVVQAVVPVNQEEEQVEPQTIKKSKGD
jgi:flavoprotein